MAQYDPARVSLNWNGIRIYGFAPDTFVSVERDEDSFSKEVGAAGDVVRIQSQNRGGKITFTLQAQSPVNDLLSAAQNADQESGDVVGPAMLKDNNGTSLAEADESWLLRPANMEYGTDGGTREWVLDCSELRMHSGGSTRP